MIKKVLYFIGGLVSAFVLTVSVVLAQTASPSPSPTVTPRATASPQVPTGAPATGMGGY